MNLLPFRFGFDASDLFTALQETRSAVSSLHVELQTQSRNIMTTQAQIAATLQELTEQANHIRDEILAKLAELEAAIGEASPEVVEKLTALRTAVQGADDIIPG